MRPDQQPALARSYAHDFHERVLNDVLARAGRYVHRSRRAVAFGGGSDRSRAIRERIAANAQKRFEIGEAMKREAGVIGHELTGECDGGVAWTDRARILAPAGENRVQLATLAHECGHVFLHGAGTPGYNLPGHVKEMEAESYAHQAFAAHGMRIPKKITAWGRAYVGQWVAADRAAGFRIDPRAVAYAAGTRSPYEPLRAVPWQWNVPTSARIGWRWHWYEMKREAAELSVYTLSHFKSGWLLCVLALVVVRIFDLMPDLPKSDSHALTAFQHIAALTGGIVWSCLALLWKTARQTNGADG